MICKYIIYVETWKHFSVCLSCAFRFVYLMGKKEKKALRNADSQRVAPEPKIFCLRKRTQRLTFVCRWLAWRLCGGVTGASLQRRSLYKYSIFWGEREKREEKRAEISNIYRPVVHDTEGGEIGTDEFVKYYRGREWEGNGESASLCWTPRCVCFPFQTWQMLR